MSLVVVAAILWLTLAPHPLPDSSVPMFEHADKIVHALMFGGLVFALLFDQELYVRRHRGRGAGSHRRNFRFLLISVVSSAVFGAVIELLQGWMGMGRGCELWDFIADFAGSLLSAVISPYVVSILFPRH